MNFVDCTFDRHASAILDIFNDAILHSTGVYEYETCTMTWMQEWFATKSVHHYPIIGVEDSTGLLLGFASYGVFRARPAYKYSVEHSVYVHRDHRGKGIGRALMQPLIVTASKQDYHIMVGGIDMDNQASVVLHEKLGFMHAGTIKQAGFKFGRWLDLGFYQLTLDTPQNPADG